MFKLFNHNHNHNQRKIIKFGTPFILTLLGSFPSGAISTESQETPRSSEISKVVDITTLKPDSTYASAIWHRHLKPQFLFIAELLALYPENTEIYFVNKNAQFLYDVARLVTDGTSDGNRFHLLNTEETDSKDSNLREVLEAQGISEASISSGKKILLVENSHYGETIFHIRDLFPQELQKNLIGHKISSGTPKVPASNVFLSSLTPEGIYTAPAYSNESAWYENLSKKFDSSVESSRELIDFRQQLVNYWTQRDNQKTFEMYVSIFTSLKKLLDQNTTESKKRVKFLLEADKRVKGGPGVQEAFVRDAIWANNVALDDSLNILLSDVGLRYQTGRWYNSNTMNQLEKKYPNETHIWQNPKVEIPKLISNRDYDLLSRIISYELPLELNEIIIDSLFFADKSLELDSLQKHFIDLNSKSLFQVVLKDLSSSYFSQPESLKSLDLLDYLIERGDEGVILDLFTSHFMRFPWTSQHRVLLDKMFKKLKYPSSFTLVLNDLAKFGDHLDDLEVLSSLIKSANLNSNSLKILEGTIIPKFPKNDNRFEILVRAIMDFSNSKDREAFIKANIGKVNLAEYSDHTQSAGIKPNAKSCVRALKGRIIKNP